MQLRCVQQTLAELVVGIVVAVTASMMSFLLLQRLVHEKVKAMFANFTINAHPMAIMAPSQCTALDPDLFGRLCPCAVDRRQLLNIRLHARDALTHVAKTKGQ